MIAILERTGDRVVCDATFNGDALPATVDETRKSAAAANPQNAGMILEQRRRA